VGELGDLAFEAFGDVGQRLLVGPFIHLGGFILQVRGRVRLFLGHGRDYHTLADNISSVRRRWLR